jgi:hypothetical protein
MLLRGRNNATSSGWNFAFWELIPVDRLIALKPFFPSNPNPYSLLNYSSRFFHVHKSMPFHYENEISFVAS